MCQRASIDAGGAPEVRDTLEPVTSVTRHRQSLAARIAGGEHCIGRTVLNFRA